MYVYKLEKPEEVTVLVDVGLQGEAGTQQKGQLLEKRSCERFKWTYLEQEQRCTDLTLQVTLSTHAEQEKTGPRLG